MFQVEILWSGVWYQVGPRYDHLAEAEWQIALWRGVNGSNGQDTGFRVVMYASGVNLGEVV